jgi:hypothetical protein
MANNTKEKYGLLCLNVLGIFVPYGLMYSPAMKRFNVMWLTRNDHRSMVCKRGFQYLRDRGYFQAQKPDGRESNNNCQISQRMVLTQ